MRHVAARGRCGGRGGAGGVGAGQETLATGQLGTVEGKGRVGGERDRGGVGVSWTGQRGSGVSSGLVGQGREGQTFSFAPTFFIGRCVVLSAVLGMAFRFSPDFEACTSPAKAAA